MISCPACAKPKSNAPHPQNNEHTLSRPADTAYTRRKKKKNSQRRGQRAQKREKQKERKKERRSAQTARKEETRSVDSLSDSTTRQTHCETPNIEKPKNTHTTHVPEWKTLVGLNTYLLYIYIALLVAQSVGQRERDEALFFRRRRTRTGSDERPRLSKVLLFPI